MNRQFLGTRVPSKGEQLAPKVCPSAKQTRTLSTQGFHCQKNISKRIDGIMNCQFLGTQVPSKGKQRRTISTQGFHTQKKSANRKETKIRNELAL